MQQQQWYSIISLIHSVSLQVIRSHTTRSLPSVVHLWSSVHENTSLASDTKLEVHYSGEPWIGDEMKACEGEVELVHTNLANRHNPHQTSIHEQYPSPATINSVQF